MTGNGIAVGVLVRYKNIPSRKGDKPWNMPKSSHR